MSVKTDDRSVRITIWFSRILRWLLGIFFITAGIWYYKEGVWPAILFGAAFVVTGFFKPNAAWMKAATCKAKTIQISPAPYEQQQVCS